MISFKAFLAEETNADISDFRKNAETMLAKNILLFRGTGTKRESLKIGKFTGSVQTARSIERGAKGSHALAKISANWEIPKRSLSYFVTRDMPHAKMFGELLLVIPADNVEMFAWTGTDWNQSVGDYKEHFANVEEQARYIFSDLDSIRSENLSKLQTKVFSTLKDVGLTRGKGHLIDPSDPRATEFLDRMVLLKQDFLDDPAESSLSEDMLELIRTIEKALKKLKKTKVSEIFADATAENFKIKTFNSLGKIPKKLKTPDEMWFNGKYLGINVKSEEDAKEVLELIINS